MENLIYKGYTINIQFDTDPQNPRHQFDNLCTMACFHSRYELGDKHDLSIDQVKRIGNNKRDFISLPLFLYDHSGITMKTTPFHCPWDSGQVGIAYVAKAKVREEYGWKRITKKRKQIILDNIVSEVETYDDYLTGQVYGYEIEETGDSRWGFYGDPEKSGLIEEAKSMVDCSIEQQCEDV